MSEHIIITGTGRSGTTFLMQLFTVLGLDTGFANTDESIDHISNAGMERDLADPELPLIVKSPWMCEYLCDELFSNPSLKVVHAIVPMRALSDAAESRRRVQRESGLECPTPGGLWGWSRPGDQEILLVQQVYRLLVTFAVHGIQMTILDFPRLAIDWRYTLDVLRRVPRLLSGVSDQQFHDAFTATSRPELIHKFQE